MSTTATPSGAKSRWANVGLVFVGGALGTALRCVLPVLLIWVPGGASLVIRSAFYGTMVINVLGAFGLGWFLEALTRRAHTRDASGAAPNPRASARRERLRLFVGTGFFGGFTTYSTLSLDTVHMIFYRNGVGALLYAGGTLVLGVLAAWGGMAIAVQRAKGAVKEAAKEEHGDVQ